MFYKHLLLKLSEMNILLDSIPTDNAFPEEGMKAVQRKKKKPLAERIAEKEAARIQQEKEEVQNSLLALDKNNNSVSGDPTYF